MTKTKLFESVKVGGLEMKNRLVMAPMCTYEVKNRDGIATDFHKVHYGARAIGGVGLIILEANAIDVNGRISEFDLCLWNDSQAEKLKELADLLHLFGSKVGIQINHAGRKAKGSTETVSASSLRFSEEYDVPKEMTKDQIHSTIEKYQRAAKYAAEAGVDVVELHAAHGYLLNQFLSPLTNHRTDEYGGNLVNRYRMLRETVDAVKKVYSGSLWVRLSAEEYDEAGTPIEDFIQIAKWLKEQGVSVADISSGGLVPKVPENVYAGYQVAIATAIRRGANIPVTTVGFLDDPKLSEFILRTEQADFIALGRPLLANPNWLMVAAKTLRAEEDYTAFNPAYERGRTI